MKPEWLRRKHIDDPNQEAVDGILRELGLNTICRESGCPNSGECFAARTATFLLLGARCTRRCAFCNVVGGTPEPVDAEEPERVARAVARLGLRYAVVTSVTRDDLPDGGAERFAQTISSIRSHSPDTAVETLVPDFQGDSGAFAAVARARPAVISHNMETVQALYPAVRPQADYRRSLGALAEIARLGIRAKTGFMLGLGETRGQILTLMSDIRETGCALLTIGQYLAPSKAHRPVSEYVHPDQFNEYGDIARRMGFRFVASAPFVRSSYRAAELLDACL